MLLDESDEKSLDELKAAESVIIIIVIICFVSTVYVH